MNKKGISNKYYGETATKYNDKRFQTKPWQSEQAILETLLNEIPDGTSVLDIPFGTGRFVDLYLTKNMIIHGLEISNEMINVAKKTLGNNFSYCEINLGDATKKLPYKDNFFDLIVCFRFINFFSYNTVVNIMHEFYRVSRSKVIIHMMVRNQHEPPVGPIDLIESVGGNLYESDVIKLFNEANFQVEKVLGKELVYQENIFDKIFRHIRYGTLVNTVFKKLSLKNIFETPNSEYRLVYLLKKEKP